MKIYETKTYHKFKSKVPFDHERRNSLDSLSEEYAQFEEVKTKLKFLNQNISRAANRGDKTQNINVSLDYLYLLGEKQKWKCALTGIPLEFTRGGTHWGGFWCNPMSCTIDRIDSTKGYIEGNLQLVIWKINSLKKDTDDQEFIDLCKLVAKNRRK